MIRLTLSIFLVLFSYSSIAGALGGEMVCTEMSKCQKGDIIRVHPGVVGLYCDLDKKVVMNDTFAICYYIGYKRDLRK